MCLLCDKLRLKNLKLSDADLLHNYNIFRDAIEPATLIDNSSADFTRHIVAPDSALNYYLHVHGGAIEAFEDVYHDKQSNSLVSIPSIDQSHLRGVVVQLDKIIDLDFREVQNHSISDISLFYSARNSDRNTLGMAVATGKRWELFLNYPEVAYNQSRRHYINVHEMGHALGLEHPFNDADGDVYRGVNDPMLSAWPEDTVMSYRSPHGDSWPNFFTDNDLNALVSIWGAEIKRLSDQGNYFIGETYSESFLGGVGSDIIFARSGNDTVRGGSGADYLWLGDGNDWANGNADNDQLRGMSGSDLIHGGIGDDWMNGNSGNDILWGDDGDDVIRGGIGDDLLIGGSGNDVLWGDDGSDRFLISTGFDTIKDFNYFAGDRIQISGGTSYSINASKAGLELVYDGGLIYLENINPVGFSVHQVVVFA